MGGFLLVLKKLPFKKTSSILPYLVLFSGCILTAWILYNPPLYVFSHGEKVPYANYQFEKKLINDIRSNRPAGARALLYAYNAGQINKRERDDIWECATRQKTGYPIYPSADFYTAILHAMGAAVITGMVFYLSKKMIAAKLQTRQDIF